MKIQEKFAIFAIVCLITASIGAILFGSSALQAVDVSFVGTGKEHSDKFIPGVNQNERAPDYGLKIHTIDGWNVVGVVSNKFMNSDTLSFNASEGIPIKHIDEILFYDDDPVEDDILERIPFSIGESVGSKYKFNVISTRSLPAGLAFFWATALGKSILLGITMGVAALIIYHFDIFDIG